MGNSQSNSSEVVAQEKLVERLTALQLKNRVMQQELEKEYAHVDFKESTPVYREGSQTVSISAVEQWEKELLEDPKNRYESLLLRPASDSSFEVSIQTDSRTYLWKQISTLGSPLESTSVHYLPESCNTFRQTNLQH